MKSKKLTGMDGGIIISRNAHFYIVCWRQDLPMNQVDAAKIERLH
ncbi:hypothetical protein [Desulfatibacillum aliphaticivorans]|nr:hypothetical protein [Desulfatibacillum aliphaticivorans]